MCGCKLCKNEAMVQWSNEDVKTCASYSNGELSVIDESGDEMIIQFDFCPMCGKKIDR